MTSQKDPYPVRFSVDYRDRPLNRVATAFRIFVTVSIFILLATVAGGIWEWSHGAGRTTVAGAGGLLFFGPLLMILFRRKYPRWWFDRDLELQRFSKGSPRMPHLGRAAFISLIASATLLAACGARGSSSDGTPTFRPPVPKGAAFYVPPSPLPRRPHGTLIWSRPLTGRPALQGAARNVLVLYHSTGVHAGVVGPVVVCAESEEEFARPVLASTALPESMRTASNA